VAREKLKSEAPSKFQIPDSYSNDPNDPNGHASSGVIKLASIKAIIEKNQHCLLDITPNAVDHLNYAQYFPICVYLKATSRNHTKELRQKYAKNLKAKSSKRLYDNALKLQTFYSHLFTHTIQLDTNQWFKKLKEAIDSQQTQPLWISQDLEHLISCPNDLTDAAAAPVVSASPPPPTEQNHHSQQQFAINSTPNGHYNNYQYQRETAASSSSSSNPNRYLFDDNFEFPIYTPANPAMSMVSSGGGGGGGVCGANTYGLYEENNYRSSFAASDSDLVASCGGGSGVGGSSLMTNMGANFTNENLIYSTNFNNKSMALGGGGMVVSSASTTGHTAVPIVLTSNDGINGSSAASSSSIISSASNNNNNKNHNYYQHQNMLNRVQSDSNMIEKNHHIENYMNSCVNEVRQNHNQMDSMNNNYSGISTYMTLNGSCANSFTSNGYNNYASLNNINGSNNFDV
jgi:guanylate kinase